MIHGYPNPFAFDMALIDPVFYMIQRGIRIDKDKRSELKHEYQLEWDKCQADLNAVAGHELNVESYPQVRQFLYKDLHLPTRRNRGKVTTDEDALRALLAISKDKMESITRTSAKIRWMRATIGITLILKIRGLRKLIESYINAKLSDDGRMHSILSIGGTRTMRFSSSKILWDKSGCNLQTIPHKIRVMFIPDDGMEIAELDLKAAESWIYSHLSNEPTMMAVLTEGRDLHVETACGISEVFGDPIRTKDWSEFEVADPDRAFKLRYTGKRSNHALTYRMGPYRFAQEVNEDSDETGVTLTVRQAKEASELWIGLYPFIKSWWDEIERQLSENSRTLVTPYGRVRQFHERWGDPLFKDATAHVPQNTAVDYINGGMLRVYHKFVVPGEWGLELLHQNHDSILIQYQKEYRDQVLPAVSAEILSDLVIGQHTIQIPVEAKYGNNWKDLTEYGETA